MVRSGKRSGGGLARGHRPSMPCFATWSRSDLRVRHACSASTNRGARAVVRPGNHDSAAAHGHRGTRSWSRRPVCCGATTMRPSHLSRRLMQPGGSRWAVRCWRSDLPQRHRALEHGRGGLSPRAFVDWDFAAPGPRVWDVAFALWWFVPLYGSHDETGSLAERARRTRSSAMRTDWLSDTGSWVTVRRRQTVLFDSLRTWAAEGVPEFVRMWRRATAMVCCAAGSCGRA